MTQDRRSKSFSILFDPLIPSMGRPSDLSPIWSGVDRGLEIMARVAVGESHNQFNTDRPIMAALHGWPRSVIDHQRG
jgi:hypothetical protein